MHKRSCLLAEKILDRNYLWWAMFGLFAWKLENSLCSQKLVLFLHTSILLWLLHTSALSAETHGWLYCEFCIIFRIPSRGFYCFCFESFLVTSSKIHTKFSNHSSSWSHGDKVPFSFPLSSFPSLKKLRKKKLSRCFVISFLINFGKILLTTEIWFTNLWLPDSFSVSCL